MELKRIRCKNPCSILEGNGPYEAFYCRDREEFLYALFKKCVSRQIKINNWQPYYESYRKDFGAFKKEFSRQWDVITGMPKEIAYSNDAVIKPDWYIFQYYETTEYYYSDKYEREEKSVHGHFNVTPLSVIRENMEQFIGQFQEESEAE